MLGSGSCAFAEMDQYEVALPADVSLLPAMPNQFHARLTWADLPHLHLLHAREAAPRLAFVKLPARHTAVIFPTHPTSSLICDGARLEFGDAMFHSQGKHFHQRTTAACSWGAVCLKPISLRTYSRILMDEESAPPAGGQVLRLAPGDRRRLLQLHAQAARIAQTQPDTATHPEVARALDQDLIWVLVAALRHGHPSAEPAESQCCRTILNELAEALLGCADRARVPEVCRILGVPVTTLRVCCSRVLGMTAGRYILLHRLRHVSRALRHAPSEPKAIAEITSRYGFSGPGHFASAYRRTFGKTHWQFSPEG